VTLGELATRVGNWAATERRLFEIVGGWVTGVEDAPLQAMLAAHSRHHGWRAGVLDAAVPAAVGLVPGSSVHDRVAALAGSGVEVEVLYGQVLPAVVDEYRAWLATAHDASDAGIARWVRLVVADTEHDLAEATDLLKGRPDVP
jgi:hypothetical protein